MKLRPKALILFVSLAFLGSHAFAASGFVSVKMDVPAGQWKAARLANLPKNAVVAVQVESKGAAHLVDRSFPGGKRTRRPR